MSFFQNNIPTYNSVKNNIPTYNSLKNNTKKNQNYNSLKNNTKNNQNYNSLPKKYLKVCICIRFFCKTILFLFELDFFEQPKIIKMCLYNCTKRRFK